MFINKCMLNIFELLDMYLGDLKKYDRLISLQRFYLNINTSPTHSKFKLSNKLYENCWSGF